MRIERTKNATRNITYGIIQKIYSIIVPFLMRTIMIYFMGVQYLGLDSLFTSILQVLNLAELGVGSAMVYGMYKPIVEDDKVTICALMKIYRLYYRVIGGIIAVIGVVLTPFIPVLVKSDLPSELNIYILYLLNLAATVCSYWLFAYKNCLLQAHQRTDVVSKITLVINTIQYVVQFLLLFIFKNYYFYVITLLIGQAAINIVTAIVVNKIYPEYKAQGKLSKNSIHDINNRVKDLFTAKIGSVVVNSADSIIISSFLGLTALAIYQNYYYIITAVIGIVSVIFNSCTAGIGNSIIVESKEKNYNDLKKFTFIISWIAGFCICALLCLFQTFMEIWVGKDLMLEFSAVICFCCYYFVYEINSLLILYKDAAGIWHKDRFRPLITALTNLVLNLILVNFIGIYGVLLSTVISTLLIGFPWLVRNLFSEIFHISPKEYLYKLLKYVIIVIITAIITYMLCSLVKGEASIIILIIKAIICAIVSNLLFFMFYRKNEEMNETIDLVKKMLKIN